MTLKELSQLYYLKNEIKKDRERLEVLRQRSFALPGSDITGMPGGGGNSGSNIERYVPEVVDLEKLIAEKIQRCIIEQSKIERYISNIPDSLTRQIFTERFVNGMSWVKVAHSVGGYNTEDNVKKICYRYIKKAT